MRTAVAQPAATPRVAVTHGTLPADAAPTTASGQTISLARPPLVVSPTLAPAAASAAPLVTSPTSATPSRVAGAGVVAAPAAANASTPLVGPTPMIIRRSGATPPSLVLSQQQQQQPAAAGGTPRTPPISEQIVSSEQCPGTLVEDLALSEIMRMMRDQQQQQHSQQQQQHPHNSVPPSRESLSLRRL
jgi:hypothetical protein